MILCLLGGFNLYLYQRGRDRVNNTDRRSGISVPSASEMLRVLAAACAATTSIAQKYDIQILEKVPQPAISVKKPIGQGYSPCTYTFNPAWFPTSATLTQNILFVRAAGCPAEYGGGNDHLLFAYCDVDGVCGDVQVSCLSSRPLFNVICITSVVPIRGHAASQFLRLSGRH